MPTPASILRLFRPKSQNIPSKTLSKKPDLLDSIIVRPDSSKIHRRSSKIASNPRSSADIRNFDGWADG